MSLTFVSYFYPSSYSPCNHIYMRQFPLNICPNYAALGLLIRFHNICSIIFLFSFRSFTDPSVIYSAFSFKSIYYTFASLHSTFCASAHTVLNPRCSSSIIFSWINIQSANKQVFFLLKTTFAIVILNFIYFKHLLLFIITLLYLHCYIKYRKYGGREINFRV